ncbi:ribonuclease P protein component [Magnetospirillum aberrantis]|uniref:Ribonuclease P protein component n=1 Tax=Magnetospirillum aberrantis SpK TaxID=908842 RepID=A0A7C9QR95_9PROT|nr:ribonuclease P protein component [Magnetospirillum aberrantis]NFV78660.1 ribonuclease P protein component [Magnetospirillum aberrantis SpK]
MPATLARLKKRADFLRVAGQRKKWATPGLVLQAAPVPSGPDSANAKADAASAGFSCCEEKAGNVVIRVGFTTSKKVGNAVARNRARRRLRAAVDEVFPASARPGLDYVVIGRAETVARPYSLLLQDLRTALKRVGGLRSESDSGRAAGEEARP